MSSARVIHCVVCRQPKASGEGWFQLMENRWTDRLKILRFHESLASQINVQSVCCSAHVRELVVHWMTIGRLDVPFARVPSIPRIFSRRTQNQDREAHEPSLPPSIFLGEFAVHRESLIRILRENPEALSVVLESLIHAIEPENDRRSAVAVASTHILAEETIAV